MFKETYLIFNPVSGQGDPERDLDLIHRQLADQTRLSVLETTPERTAAELAKQAIDKGADCVIASGGDGTVSEVASVLVGAEATLGIVPRGTANAIAAAFDISTNIVEACNIIIEGVSRDIDIATCEGRPFVLLAGVGLEAEVVSGANRQLKNRIGTAAYILSAFQQVTDLPSFEVELETYDRIISADAAGVTVANVAPATSVLAQGPADVLPSDGFLDVTIFSPQGTGGAIAASYNLFQTAINKRSSQREDIGYFRCKRLKVSTTPAQKIVLDGELIGETPVEIACLPWAVSLMTPKNGNFDPLERLQGLPNLKIHYKQAHPQP